MASKSGGSSEGDELDPINDSHYQTKLLLGQVSFSDHIQSEIPSKDRSIFADRLTTLGGHVEWKINQDAIEYITNLMTYNWSLGCHKPIPEVGSIPAGVTYLSQMLTHEITPSTKLDGAMHDNATPKLDLDSIYPKTIEEGITQGVLDDSDARKYEFKLRKICVFKTSPRFDFVRDSTGDTSGEYRAMIVDKRSDENVFLSQLIVEWLLLHNRLMVLSESEQPDAEKRYHAVRTCVALLFQRSIVDQVCHYCLDPSVRDFYFKKRHGQLEKLVFFRSDKKGWAIPIEFSHAFFRFGHALVRQSYHRFVSSDDRPVSIRLENSFRVNKKLEAEQLVDWDLFFFDPTDHTNLPNGANVAAPIGHSLAGAMTLVVNGESVQPDSTEFVEVLERSLLSDASAPPAMSTKIKNLLKLDLRRSRHVCTFSKILELIGSDINISKRLEPFIYKKYDLDSEFSFFKEKASPQLGPVKIKVGGPGNQKPVPLSYSSAPLWLSVLEEADSGCSKDAYGNIRPIKGKHVGPLSSMVICEVLRRCLQSTSVNILSDDKFEAMKGLPYVLQGILNQSVFHDQYRRLEMADIFSLAKT